MLIHWNTVDLFVFSIIFGIVGACITGLIAAKANQREINEVYAEWQESQQKLRDGIDKAVKAAYNRGRTEGIAAAARATVEEIESRDWQSVRRDPAKEAAMPRQHLTVQLSSPKPASPDRRN